MDVPKRHAPLVALLKAAYPSGIPREDYFPLLKLLHEEMTFRAVAKVMECLGKDAQFAYWDASTADAEDGPSSGEVKRVRERLVHHGWEAWRTAPEIEDDGAE